MSPKGSDGQIGFDLDSYLGSVETRIQNHLRPVGWGLFFVSVVCLVLWLVTVMVFPARDARRERIPVALNDQKTIVVDYPVRLLAEEIAQPIYLTSDSRDSVSITLELTSSLSLILVSAEPSSTLKIEDPAAGLIAVTWPALEPALVAPSPTPHATSVSTHTLTSTSVSSPTSTATPVSSVSPAAPMTGAATPPALIPLLPQPSTITLKFRNASTVQEKSLISLITGFANASLIVKEGKTEIGKIPLQIETTARASWRSFAKNYSFLAVLPFLVSAFGFLTKTYIDYRKSKKADANEALKDLLHAIAHEEKDAIAKNEKLLTQLTQYVPPDDFDQTIRILRFSRGEILSPIDVEELKVQPEVWVGALCLAANHLSQSSDQTQVSKTSDSNANTAPSDKESQSQGNDQSQEGQTTNSKANTTPSDAESHRFKTDLYRLIRIFPLDLVSPEAEKRLRESREKLGFPAPQPHDWPKLAAPPEDNQEALADNTSIRALRLFPSETGDALKEIGYLFSERALYWREHPLIEKLRTCLQPTLVCGDIGSGRTALALALTRYAEHEEKTLGSYLDRPASLAEAQQAIGRELMGFLRWRSTWLSKLEREDRDLLASLLLCVFDSRILIARLGEPELAQFDPPKKLNSNSGGTKTAPNTTEKPDISSGDTTWRQMESNSADPRSQNLKTDDEKNRPVWEGQAAVEFRLLRRSVERMTGKPRLTTVQWFYGLSTCAKRMSFAHVRIAFDITREQYEQWRGDHLDQFLATLSTDHDIPLQLIVLVPGSSASFNIEKRDMAVQQLQWDAEFDNGTPYLMQMFKYRLEQRTKITGENLEAKYRELGLTDIQHELCTAAHHNPRRMAKLWSEIQSEFPSASKIETNMVTKAAAEVT